MYTDTLHFKKDPVTVCLGAQSQHYQVYIEGDLKSCRTFVSEDLMATNNNHISVAANLTANCLYKLQIESVNEAGKANSTADLVFGEYSSYCSL